MGDILRVTSCQARNTFPLMAELAAYLSDKLLMPVDYVTQPSWLQRYQDLYAGKIQLGWICSRPYGMQLNAEPRLLFTVATPVFHGALYGGKAIYFSYLVVRQENSARELADLRNYRVAYNESLSQSGYFSLLHALKALKAGPEFFAEWVESGAHLQSIALIREGAVDAAAIDSTLWDFELHRDQHAFDDLQVIASIGPFPAPPLVVHVSVPAQQRRQLQNILTGLHLDPEGKGILSRNLVNCFVTVDDATYRQLL